MSGGSLASVLAVREKYGSSWFLSGNSSILSSDPKRPQTTTPWFTRILGYRFILSFGTLTTSFVGPGNASIVHTTSTNPTSPIPNTSPQLTPSPLSSSTS
ncbi:hypothetical protein BDZ45DRAFT_673689 [Acephala macrosclerotiorum]|nr:hypothetical protein BDZ45DRAFT_673689 [Acephala macrosclerotiorum]